MRFLRNNLGRPAWAGLLLAALIGLSGCGGSGSGSGGSPPTGNPPTQPPPTTAAPTAAFTAVDSAPLNTVVIFDASTSTSGDGALQYFWDFGGGQRGGGAVIARMFATPGATNVTLTVVDAGGRRATQSRTITIAAPTTPLPTVTAQGSVKSLDQTALQGVTVTPFGATTSATTDAMGKASVSIAVGAPLSVKLSKDGFADQFVSLTMPTTAGADAYFEAVMRPRDAALTLPNAAAGGSLNGRDGATITLPANALVDASGTAVTGAVQIAMTPVNVTDAGAGGFPGSFDGITPSGATTPIVSFGTVEYVLSANGNKLQLAPGKTAVIEVPLYATESIDGTMLIAGTSVPLWSLDEETGIWVQEGEGTVVASASSPTGLAMRATVSHFTWWNADLGFDPFGPQPDCMAAGDIGIPEARDYLANATICNMLAEAERTLGGGGTPKGRVTMNAVSPRFAGYSRRAIVPTGGGVTIPVPANTDIALSATAVNGAWTGRAVVNGPVGERRRVVIEMRPLQSTGPDPDLITLPFDGQRSLSTNQTSLFNFNAPGSRYVRVTVTQVNGSTLAGNVRLLQGQSVLATATYGTFNSQPIVAPLATAARYTIEITGMSGVPGAYRLQVELLGATSAEAITIPFSTGNDPVQLPALTFQQKTFTVATPFTAHVAFQHYSGGVTAAALIGPNGPVYNFTSPGAERTDAAVVNLTPGNYMLSIGSARGQQSFYRSKIEQTAWEHVGTPLDGIMNSYNVIGVKADANGRPVVGFTREFVVNARPQSAVVLKRWSGTAWQDVGTELVIEWPCTSTDSIDFVMDSTNAPVVIFGSSHYLAPASSYTTVRRFSGGTWQGVGPNDGVLPHSDVYSTACDMPPVVRVDSNDRLVVAYMSYQGVATMYAQRLDGTNWTDLLTSTTLSPSTSGIELQFDANDRLWMVLTNPAHRYGQVSRLNPTPTPTWVAIGPNNGDLPSATNLDAVYAPRLRFDASGNPLIGGTASIGTTSFSSGVIVYRYNGTTWSTTGGYQPAGAGSRSATSRTHSFTVSSTGEAISAWINNFTDSPQTVLMAQINTSSGWTPIGPGDGRVPQFTSNGITTQRQATQTRLVTIGADVYMAVAVQATDFNTTTPRRVYLLKRAANY